MKPGDDREALTRFIDGLRESKSQHIPAAVDEHGDLVVSAWEDGFNRAILLVMEEVLELRVGR